MTQGIERKVGQRQWRQLRGKRADGLDAGGGLAQPDIQDLGDDAADNHRHDHVRNLLDVAAGEDARHQGDDADTGDPGVDVAGLRNELMDDLVEGRAARDPDAEEIAHLTGGDQDGGAGGEADDHRVRDEIDQCAHARQSQDQLEHADQESERQHQADVVRRARLGLVGKGGEDGDGDRRGRAGDEMPGGAEERADHCRHHRCIEAVLRRQAGDGGEGDALRKDDQCAGEARQQVVLCRLPIDQRPPEQEGKQLAQPEGVVCGHGGMRKGA